MGYIALYRNYRPSSFSEVAGQKHIIKTIKNAVKSNKTSHAYIFSGQRGIGKTTIARILAKAVNCKNCVDGEPCNICENCLSIANGQTPDIIEIDAASNNGVDEMRSLLEKVNFLPSQLTKKVYIIDEAHMLSISAFNALLKTLEEPPLHVMFILATTEPHKIPMTILSRCQKFDFKQLTNGEIVERLEKICQEENIDIKKEALEAIAESAEGGMRDAVSTLDQVNSYSTSTITIEDVDSVTGRVSNYKLVELVKSFNNKDTNKALELIDELLDEGKEISQLINNLIQFCRDILLYKSKVTPNNVRNIYISSEFNELLSVVKENEVFYYIDVLMDTSNKIRFTTSQKIYLEVAIMKIIALQKDNIDVSNKLSELEEKIGNSTYSQKGLSKEMEIKIVETELKVKKIVDELNRLNLNEFKESTIGKLNMLEEVSSYSKALPSNIIERIENLENNSAEKVLTEKGNSVFDDAKIQEITNKVNVLEESILNSIGEFITNSQLEELKKDIYIKLNSNSLENKLSELETKISLIKENNDTTVDVENINSNSVIDEYREEVSELKENYFVLINKINEISPQTDIDMFDENLGENKKGIKDEIINETLEVIEDIKKEIDEKISIHDIKINELINLPKVDYKKEIDSLEDRINLLETRKQDFDYEEFKTELYKYVDDVKEYNLKLSLKIQELSEKINNSEEQIEKSQNITKEEKEIKIVKEEKHVEGIKSIQGEDIKEPVMQKAEVKTEPIIKVDNDDATNKIYDVKIIERILHQSRDAKMREEKSFLLSKWKTIANSASSVLQSSAELLRDGILTANGENELLIIYPSASICNHLMSPKVHSEIRELLKITFNKEYDFIALPENTWQEKRKEYIGQYSMGMKYPKLTPINNPELKIIVVKQEKKVDATFEKIATFFGNEITRREN